jgi:hypothetical protein
VNQTDNNQPRLLLPPDVSSGVAEPSHHCGEQGIAGLTFSSHARQEIGDLPCTHVCFSIHNVIKLAICQTSRGQEIYCTLSLPSSPPAAHGVRACSDTVWERSLHAVHGCPAHTFSEHLALE